MKDADVEEMRTYISGFFREAWPLIKSVIGNNANDSDWDSIFAKAREWTDFNIHTPYDFKKLTIEDQIKYKMGEFLFDWIDLADRANKVMRLKDGENVNLYGACEYKSG